jgi:hypothetical protein
MPNPLGVALKDAVAKGQAAALGLWTVLSAPKARKPLLIGGGVVASLLVVVALWPESAPPPVLRVPVTLSVTPAEAEVKIDDEVRSAGTFEMAPGKHTVEATLEGFQPFRQEFEVPPGDLPVKLVPLASLVRVVTDLTSGSVLLNDTKVADLIEGQYTLENPPAGSHTLKIESGKLTAVIPFTVSEGAAPVVGPEATASELKMVAVASYRGRGKAHSNLGKGILEVDGVPAGEMTAEGLELAGFAAGSRQLVFRAGPAGEHTVPIDIPSNPSLLVSLTTDRNVGSILVSADQDGYRVFVDDQDRTRPQKDGKQTVPNLDVGKRVVRIEKDDFRVDPEVQPVEVKKGRRVTAEFKLIPLPQGSTLVVEGAPAGMTVVVGGRSLPVGSDGRLTRNDIGPGDHDIQLRRNGYRSKTLNRRFEKRQTVRLAGADLNLETALGSIQFTRLSPPTMQIAIKQTEVIVPYTGPATVTGPKQITLPFGRYNLTGSAPGFKEETKSFDVRHEDALQVVFELSAEAPDVRKVERPKPVGMEGWPIPWPVEDGWATRRGGLVLFNPQPTAGTFRFTIKRPAGGVFRIGRGDPIEWLCNVTADKSYVVFRLTDGALETLVAKDGPERRTSQKRHNLDDKTEYAVDVFVRPNAITVSIKDKGAEKLSTSQQGQNLDHGQFGFRVNTGGTLRIKDFLFTPAQ